MGYPPVRGDNPRALASGLSYVQADKHGITILDHLHQCRPCTSRDIHSKVGKVGIYSASVPTLWYQNMRDRREGRSKCSFCQLRINAMAVERIYEYYRSQHEFCMI